MRTFLLFAVVVLALGGSATAIGLDMGEDYSREHVDMNVSSIRLCGKFPFYYPCVDIDYWLPKWQATTKLLTVQSVSYSAGNAEAAGPMTGSQALHFFDAEVKPVFLGFGDDMSDDFLQPCTRNRLCMGVPTPEASPAALNDDFYHYRSGCSLANYEACAANLEGCRITNSDSCAEKLKQCITTGAKTKSACNSEATRCLEGCGICKMCEDDPCWEREVNLHVGALGTEDGNRCNTDFPSGGGEVKAMGLFVAFNIPPPYPFGWGNALPRTGHVTHSSATAASGLAALRAFNVARYPVDVWPQFGFQRTPVAFFGKDELDGPAPIGQPAVMPWVGPFPCMHLRPNADTGLLYDPSKVVGTDCFPAGLWLEDAMGQPYHKATKKAWDDANDTGRKAGNPQKPENFDWVFWRYRKCTCPWPSPSALYAQWFEKKTGTRRNACIRPSSNVTQLAKDVTKAAANKFRNLLKSTYNAAKTAANQTTGLLEQTTVGMVENLVGDPNNPFTAAGDTSAAVSGADDERGMLGSQAEGYRGDTRGGVTQTMEVRGATAVTRETTTWTSETGVTSTIEQSTAGQAYKDDRLGASSSTLAVGASTLGTTAGSTVGKDKGIFSSIGGLEKDGWDKTKTAVLYERDAQGNFIKTDANGNPTQNKRRIPQDLFGVAGKNRKEANLENLSLGAAGAAVAKVAGEMPPPSTGSWIQDSMQPITNDSLWNNVNAVFGDAASCDTKIGNLIGTSSLSPLTGNFCQQPTCRVNDAEVCVSDVADAYARCLAKKAKFDTDLAAWQTCSGGCSNDKTTCEGLCTVCSDPNDTACLVLFRACQKTCSDTYATCMTSCGVGPKESHSIYQWTGPMREQKTMTGFAFCTGDKKAALEALAEDGCRKHATGCCSKGDNTGSLANLSFDIDTASGAVFRPGDGANATLMSCQNLYGQDPTFSTAP